MDSNYTERIQMRRQVIRDHAEHVLGCIPGPPTSASSHVPARGGGDTQETSSQQHDRGLYNGSVGGVEAVRELYSYLLGEYLPKRYPTLFALEDDSSSSSTPDGNNRGDTVTKSEEELKTKKKVFHNKITGARFPAELPPLAPTDTQAAMEALKILGETVEDDLTLLQQDPGTPTTTTTGAETGAEGGAEEPGLHRLVATVVCNPSGFDPAEKMGKVLRDIHAPVPSYGKIEKSMERFFSRLEVGKSSSRINVSSFSFPPVVLAFDGRLRMKSLKVGL